MPVNNPEHRHNDSAEIKDRSPWIGITSALMEIKSRIYSGACRAYLKAITIGGGLPYLLPLMDENRFTNVYIERMDGLLLTGGTENIDPDLYDEEPGAGFGYLLPERDQWEVALARAAIEAGIPVLGICRGAQLLNVACGGSLVQKIPDQVSGAGEHFPAQMRMCHLFHHVTLAPKSKLHEIFGQERIRVNSFHFQAVNEVAPGFTVTARSDDGIIEAIEKKSPGFVVGVQWHPECLVETYPRFQKLFKTFVAAAVVSRDQHAADRD